ncbi:hypothetical protein CEXT_301611 [Caerostris extrusa]|uniref:Uncharacterized protein n=1 Tax=Caerostris extrusa TaxID=172846 RepID=A0AAV4T3B6_CAEEX|nr:hypothetical protein CEXT_301611 [Caerostris extrusa]
MKMYFSVPGENGIVRKETSPGDESIKEGFVSRFVPVSGRKPSKSELSWPANENKNEINSTQSSFSPTRSFSQIFEAPHIYLLQKTRLVPVINLNINRYRQRVISQELNRGSSVPNKVAFTTHRGSYFIEEDAQNINKYCSPGENGRDMKIYFSVPGENGIIRKETSPGDESIKGGFVSRFVSVQRAGNRRGEIIEEQSLLFLLRDIALSTPTRRSKGALRPPITV